MNKDEVERYIEEMRRQFDQAIASAPVQWRVPFFGINGCDHELKLYVGAREVYSYCVKCDHKEEVPK